METPSFNVDASIYNLILTYLQPFELAVVTGMHTKTTYYNAIKHDCVEYLTMHKSVCTNFNMALYEAAGEGCLCAIKLFISFGADDINNALHFATIANQFDAVKLISCDAHINMKNNALYSATGSGLVDMIDLLVVLGANGLNHALRYAAGNGQVDAVKKLVELGATALEHALRHAVARNQPAAVEVLKLLQKNQD